jgi:hypothetical protein
MHLRCHCTFSNSSQQVRQSSNAFEERREPKLTRLSHRRQNCTPAGSRRSRRRPRSPLLCAIALARQPTSPATVLCCQAASWADDVLTRQISDSASWGDGKRVGASGGGKEKLRARSRLLPCRRLRARPPQPWGLAQHSSPPTARLGAPRMRPSPIEVHSDAARRSTGKVVARRGRSTCVVEAIYASGAATR